MTQSSPQPTHQFRGKLTHTTLMLLLPLTTIPIALLGFIILFKTTRFLREQVFVQFTELIQSPRLDDRLSLATTRLISATMMLSLTGDLI